VNRSLTNAIRFVLDECLPPVIRDSWWFMYPFFFLAYRGKNVREAMDFKRLVYSFSEAEYENFYASLDTISRNRKTDLNEPSIAAMLAGIPPNAQNLLDVGCGRGYFLDRVRQHRPDLQLMGYDLVDKMATEGIPLTRGRLEKLPFADASFDVVTCSHTLEHILSPSAAISELKRVARHVLYVAVPCQRHFYYTLDEHVNFYPQKEILTAQMGIKESDCVKLHGDWLYKATLPSAAQLSHPR
jgi:ubiquinone/menaquinone biosynthesis C-methylase UbiE